MAKVKLLVSLAGEPSGAPGDVVEVTQEEAERFAVEGFGEIVEEESKKAKK